MTQLRSVNTHFWKDGFIASCTPLERYIFLYLLTNEAATLAGCYELSLRRLMFDTGTSKAVVERAIEKFKDAGKIEFRDGWLVLNSFHKHQNLNANMGIAAKKVLICAPEWVRNLTRKNLERFGTLPEWFPNGSGTVKGSEVEDEVEDEKEKKPEPGVLEIHLGTILAGIKKELGLHKMVGERDWITHGTLAFQNGQSAEDFLECLSLLRKQEWRTSAVKPTHVTENLPELAKLRREAKQKGNGQLPSLAEKLAADEAQRKQIVRPPAKAA